MKSFSRIFSHLSILLLIFIPTITLIIASFFGYFIYREEIQLYSKTISVLSFYKEPINFTIENNKYELEMFDTKIIKIKTRERFNVDVFNSKNEKITTLYFDQLAKDPHLDLNVIGAKTELCFFNADVTNIYYEKNLEKKLIKSINILSDVPTVSTFRTFPTNSINVYPGKSNINSLPSTITNGVKVWGTFPIECKDIKNEKKLIETVKIFQNYNSEKFREHYFKEIERINNLTI